MSKYSTKETERYAAIFKALSNVNRLQIFLNLCQCCQPGTVCRPEEVEVRCVGELGSGLDVSASTLSHHIKELNRAGLIKIRRKGQYVECWIDPDVLTDLSQFFNFKQQELCHEPT